MFKDYTLQTTLRRALVAIIWGAFIGALIIAAYWAFLVSPQMFLRNAIRFVFAKSVNAFMILGLGILLVGGPIWLVLHKAGLRTWPIAIFIGFLLPFSLFFLIFTGQVSDFEALQESFDELAFLTRPVFNSGVLAVLDGGRAAAISSVFGVVGSFIALTIWRIAYRRPTLNA